MVNVCYNPECKKELCYLREGRVVRVVHGGGDEARLEHFWLCGHCSRIYGFVLPSDGPVGLKVRDSQPTLDSVAATGGGSEPGQGDAEGGDPKNGWSLPN
jgi:hypothetical protein